jgi:hypothetical protein
MQTSTDLHTHKRMHSHTHIHTYIQTHTHTYTHTLTLVASQALGHDDHVKEFQRKVAHYVLGPFPANPTAKKKGKTIDF